MKEKSVHYSHVLSLQNLRIRYFLIILFFAPVCEAYAQKVDISPSQRFNIRSGNVEILGKIDEDVYIHVNRSRGNEIIAFRENMSVRWERELPTYNRNERIEKVLLMDKKLQVFSSDRVRNQYYLSHATYDKNMGLVTRNERMDTINLGLGEAFPNLKFTFTEDRKKIMLHYTTRKMNRNDHFHYIVFNTDLTIESQNSFPLPLEDKKTSFYDALINNRGEVYVIMSEFEDRRMEHCIKYRVLSSTSGFAKSDNKLLEARENFYFNNTKFKMDNHNEQIVAAGFYTEDIRRPVSAEGIFYYILSLSGNTTSVVNYQTFEPEFIARIKSNKSLRRNERLHSFYIDDIILRLDGGALIIAESFYRTWRNMSFHHDPYLQQPAESTITYHFEEMMVVNVHPDGNIHWKHILPKSQVSVGDLGRHSSFSMINAGSAISFIYNDQASTRANVVQYIIEPSGEQYRNTIVNGRRFNIFLMPQYGVQVSYNEIVIPSLKGRNLTFIKFTY